MQEKMSIELEALIGKFENNMDKAQDIINKWYDKCKEVNKIEISPTLNTSQLNQELIKSRKELDDFKNKGITTASQIEQVAVLTNKIEALRSRIKQLGGTPWELKNAEEVKEDTEEVAKNMDIIKIKATTSGGGLSNAFSKATKSLKRFALSLFGIRSIWSVLSKATSTYMSQNKELSNTIKGVWTGLGTLVAPLVEVIANVFLKLLGYINEVTKALFNYDFIAKANAKTMENYTKKTNKASKALAGFDEIQNLNQQDSESNTGPEGLIKLPKLDEGIVKGLQDISYWLKDNWDWLQWVAYGLGIAFGASAVAKWLGGIGNLLGWGTAGVAGGSGLIGLCLTLVLLAELLQLAYEGWKLYNGVKENKEYNKGLTEDYEKINNDTNELIKDTDKYITKVGKNSTKASQKIANLASTIQGANNTLRLVEEQQPKNVFDNWAYFLDGTTTRLAKMESGAKKSLGNAREEVKELAKQGDLTTTQINKLNDAFGYEYILVDNLGDIYVDTGNKIESTGGKVRDLDTFYQNLYGTTDILDAKQKGLNSTIGNTSTAVDGLYNKYNGEIDNTGNKIDNLSTKTEAYFVNLKKYTDKDYKVNVTTEVKTVYKGGGGSSGGTGSSRSWGNSSSSSTFDLLLVELERLFRKLPFLSIGTDNVMAEGLAYLHKGEKVVPADVASGGFSGNNNETNALLRQLIQTLDNKEFSATISSSDVGRASVKYINDQKRIMGGSVI